jgi:hypothetical protein
MGHIKIAFKASNFYIMVDREPKTPQYIKLHNILNCAASP